MKCAYVSTLLIASSLGIGGAIAATEHPAADRPLMIDGVQTVCTGSGEGTRANPAWRAYPTRIEFAGKHGQYLGDDSVSVTGQGKRISVHCTGPWVLMKLPQGSYKLSAGIKGIGHQDLTIRAPGRVIIRFPEAGGRVTVSS